MLVEAAYIEETLLQLSLSQLPLFIVIAEKNISLNQQEKWETRSILPSNRLLRFQGEYLNSEKETFFLSARHAQLDSQRGKAIRLFFCQWPEPRLGNR